MFDFIKGFFTAFAKIAWSPYIFNRIKATRGPSQSPFRNTVTCKGRQQTQYLFQPENQKSSDVRMVWGCGPHWGWEERKRASSTGKQGYRRGGWLLPSDQDTAETFGRLAPRAWVRRGHPAVPGARLSVGEIWGHLGGLRQWLFTSGYGDTAVFYHGYCQQHRGIPAARADWLSRGGPNKTEPPADHQVVSSEALYSQHGCWANPCDCQALNWIAAGWFRQPT